MWHYLPFMGERRGGAGWSEFWKDLKHHLPKMWERCRGGWELWVSHNLFHKVRFTEGAFHQTIKAQLESMKIFHFKFNFYSGKDGS